MLISKRCPAIDSSARVRFRVRRAFGWMSRTVKMHNMATWGASGSQGVHSAV